jgi:hypothetical protein
MDYFSSNNVSEKYQAVWIAPERTGSRTVAQILNYCGFRRNQKPISLCEKHDYTHRFNDPELFNDWIHICGARNPYARTYSIFKMISNNQKDSFKEFILNKNFNYRGKEMFLNPRFYKKPEYVVRLENMKEDIDKIPFVKNHISETQLDYMLIHGKSLSSWEEHYNDEMKEIVYEVTKHQFEAWGYEK